MSMVCPSKARHFQRAGKRAPSRFPVAARRRATGWCLEAHDLAASKLVAFREKDRAFVRTLMVEHLVRTETLLDRIVLLPVDDTLRLRLAEWVRATAGG